jgi:1,4-alpha-glucan branching enzyme
MRISGAYVITFFWALLMFSSCPALAQKGGNLVREENGMVIVSFDRRNAQQFNDLMKYFDLNEDSLFNHASIGNLSKEGWKLYHLDKNVAEIAMPLAPDKKDINWGKQPIFLVTPDKPGLPGSPGYPVAVPYGMNNFKGRPSVFMNRNNESVFVLRDAPSSASKVILSGNFNDWSTSRTVMKKTDTGWVATMNLIPGKYLYKFIVDGKWIQDYNNTLREPDGHGGNNSTYFHNNYTFRLSGYTNAQSVFVTGSFNNWREKELKMKKTNGGWELNLYLAEGTHGYKFIVDGQWILDPANKVTRPDGKGNVNSVLELGEVTTFTLKGYTEARSAILTGSFNGWNTAEVQMTKTATGWMATYALAPGNYEYKFIVDGRWMADPGNPIGVGGGEHRNSVIAVKPNYEFRLNKFPDAKSVAVTGSFNGWADPGYTMRKQNGIWSCPVFLASGKYTYKFIVDGKWILDPDNPLMEDNEYNTGNSVIWIEAEKQYLGN